MRLAVITGLGVAVTTLVNAGPGDDETRVVECWQGNVEVTCFQTQTYDDQTTTFWDRCQYDHNYDNPNRAESAKCAAGQQCTMDLQGEIDVSSSALFDAVESGGLKMQATLGCGSSQRYKGADWNSDLTTQEGYYNQERICYPDMAGNPIDVSGFSDTRFKCFCLDNMCNTAHYLPQEYVEKLRTSANTRGVAPEASVTDTPDEYDDVTDDYSVSGDQGLEDEYQTEEPPPPAQEEPTTLPAETVPVTESQDPTTEEARITEKPTTYAEEGEADAVEDETDAPEVVPDKPPPTVSENNPSDANSDEQVQTESSTGLLLSVAVLACIVVFETLLLAFIYVKETIPGKETIKVVKPAQAS